MRETITNDNIHNGRLNKPFSPRSCVCNSRQSSLPNETRKTTLDTHKRIFKMAAI